MLTEKVTLLQTKSVYERIQTFLSDLKSKTRTNYESDITQFFQVMRNKELSQLTEQDLVFEGEDIRQYKNYLKSIYKRVNPLSNKEEPVASTVERKIQAVKSLFFTLSPDLQFIRMEIFNLKGLKMNPLKLGVLTYDEYLEMVQLANNYGDRGLETSVAIEILGITGIREEAILSITPQNLFKMGDFWVLHVVDKGGVEDRKTLPQSLYDRLQLLRKGDNDHYFTISPSTLLRRVKHLAGKMGIEARRRITVHSLKKMGINDISKRSGDIELARMHGNHKNVQTTREHYLEATFDPSKSTSLMIGQSPDMSILETYSKEELLQLIKKCSYSTQFEITLLATTK